MKFNSTSIIAVIILLLIVSNCKTIKPVKYTPVDKTLYHTIYEQDSMLFSAFNARDFEKFKSFFSDKLEIYQDNIGVRDYAQSMEAFKGLFEGSYILKRTLLKETLEVYPIKDYGAIETGQHTFCHTENGKQDCGTYKFLHIWEYKNGTWKIARIVTYDH